jgi:hypothetical protein
MKYSKPEVSVLGTAVELILIPLKSSSNQDSGGDQTNVPAYDLDD